VVSGQPLGVLIGRRGDTLAALQYVLTLLVQRRLRRWVRVTVDVAHYRDRQEAVLRVEPRQVESLLHRRLDPNAEVVEIGAGVPASPGAAIGAAVFDADVAEERGRAGEQVILVRIATDPDEYLKVASDKVLPADKVVAWQRDRAGALVDVTLADKYGWKIGDKITLLGSIFPVNPELTIRGIYHRDPPQNALYFNAKYLEESLDWFKGRAGWFATQVAEPGDVARVSSEIDDMFRNSPQRTKTESEKAFQLSIVAMLGNVKAFILGVCGAVVFAILLVSANTMAMSVRSRTREVAVLKTLGFTRQSVLSLFVLEAVALAMSGGMVGIAAAAGVIRWLTHSSVAIGIPTDMRVTLPAVALSLLVSATVGFLSGYIPAYGASRINIVEGLRHIG